MNDRKLWLNWRALAVIAVCGFLGVVETSLAAPLRAAVAQVSANGTVTLLENRLVDHFPNGVAVAEASLDVSNGFLRLVRKGFKPNGDCTREVASLVDANNIAVPVGGAVAGNLWVIDQTPIAVMKCSDNGCHALKNVVLPGEPPLVYARCDRSDGVCECHTNDGTGDSTVPNGALCTSFFEKSVLQIDSWVLQPFID